MQETPSLINIVRDLLRAYRNAITRPDVETFREEVPNASWQRVWISLGLSILVSIVADLLLATIRYSPLAWYWSLLSSIFMIPIGFFLTALFLYGLGRFMEGKGETQNFRNDFLTHAYLLVIINTPLSFIQSLLSLIPRFECSGLISLAIGIFGLFLIRNAIRVSMNLAASQATCAVLLLVIFLIVVILCLFFTIVLPLISSTITDVIPPIFRQVTPQP
jgi:hypothetical protein